MNCIITDEQVLFGHAKGHTEDVFDEVEDKRGPDDVPSNDEQSTNNLPVIYTSTSHISTKELQICTYNQTCLPLPAIAPPGLVNPKAALPCTVARMPVIKPPRAPATKWVWNTPRQSSTFLKVLHFFPKVFMVIHGTDPERRPITIAPHPVITPAAGVMATSPVIIPLTAPRTEGFL